MTDRMCVVNLYLKMVLLVTLLLKKRFLEEAHMKNNR